MKPCIIQPELLDSVVGSTIRVIPYNNVVVNRHTLLVNFKRTFLQHAALGYRCSCCYTNKRRPRLLFVTKTLPAFYLTKKALVIINIHSTHTHILCKQTLNIMTCVIIPTFYLIIMTFISKLLSSVIIMTFYFLYDLP